MNLLKTDPPHCPNCGEMMSANYENQGYEPPEGPPHYEITHYYCAICGIEDGEIEEEKVIN